MVISKNWIIDASPLILLGKIGHLKLLDLLAPSLGVPGSVINEIAVGNSGDAFTETTVS